MILLLRAIPSHLGSHFGLMEDRRQVYALRLPVRDRLFRLEAVRAPHHLINGAESKFRHDLAHVLRDKAQKADDVVGRTHKLLAQLGVLRSYAHRAGIEMAHAHHDAAHGHKTRSSKTKLLGA